MGSNTIVINGKHYDAKTGRLLTPHSKPVEPAHKRSAPKHKGMVLDGFARRPAAAHAVHAKTEKSKTLRRDAVAKPHAPQIHSKTSSPHVRTVHHQPISHDKPLPENHDRLARATKVPKSSLISRFGRPAEHMEPKQHKLAHVPVAQAPAISHHDAPPIIPPSFRPNPFDNALQNATSHHQAAPAKHSRRHRVARALRISPKTLSFGSFIVSGLLLGGFFVYQNIPNLAMKVAATRSGVSANLPGYKPAGFAVAGPIKYSPGKVSISYRSTTDAERTFQVSQSASEWNSETLLDKFVAAERRAYQTYQGKDKTIYIYDEANATWVDDGVWYQVEGNASLSSDQLLRIANSL